MKYLIIFGIIALISCKAQTEALPDNQQTQKSDLNDTLVTAHLIEDTLNEEIELEAFSGIDFLTGCDSLIMWFGGIQGGKPNDESCCYVMAQCQSNYHYDLIMFHPSKAEIKNYIVGETIASNIPNSTFFAFEIQKTKPSNPENEFDTYDYVFPSRVRVFQKVNLKWKFIHDKLVHNFDELGELKNEIISRQTRPK